MALSRPHFPFTFAQPGRGGRLCAVRTSEGGGCASLLSFSSPLPSAPLRLSGPEARPLPREWPLASSLGLANPDTLGVPEALAVAHSAPLLSSAGALVSERHPDPRVEPGTTGGGRLMGKSRDSEVAEMGQRRWPRSGPKAGAAEGEAGGRKEEKREPGREEERGPDAEAQDWGEGGKAEKWGGHMALSLALASTCRDSASPTDSGSSLCEQRGPGTPQNASPAPSSGSASRKRPVKGFLNSRVGDLDGGRGGYRRKMHNERVAVGTVVTSHVLGAPTVRPSLR